MGYSNPDWTYGFSHNFSYKNFSLSLLFDGRIGGMMYSTTNQKMWWGGIAPGTVNQFGMMLMLVKILISHQELKLQRVLLPMIKMVM